MSLGVSLIGKSIDFDSIIEEKDFFEMENDCNEVSSKLTVTLIRGYIR